MARANKTKVNLLVRSKRDGRMGTATKTIRPFEGRKGFRGYVGTHDTIRGYRSPKHRVIPASQDQERPLLYNVVWHSSPAEPPKPRVFLTRRGPLMPISCPPIIFKSRRGGRIDGRHRIQTSAMHRMQSSAMEAELMAGDYYSLNDIAILTKETQNGES